MNANQQTQWMHAVLDGTATPEESRALDALLASSADARAEFASWQQLFQSLGSLPMAHPPEGLVAAVSAALPRTPPAPAAEIFAGHDQLSFGPSVLASGQAKRDDLTRGFRAMLRRLGATKESDHMNINRKVWAGSGVAVVALGVAAFVSGYPPKADNVTGTVVPAERYRATQAGAEAVKLGTPDGTPANATDTAATGVIAGNTDANRAVADRAVADRAIADRAIADRAIADRAIADRAIADRAIADRATADRAAADRAIADRALADRAKADRAVADRAVADRAQVDRAFADRAKADRAIADRVQADRAKADRATAERNQADRAQSDRTAQ